MKKVLSIICTGVVLSLLFSSCTKPINPAVVEYYITANESSNFESLIITFNDVQAFQESGEVGTSAIVSIYLDRQFLSLTTDGTQEPIFLGSSKIEPRKIDGYKFTFSSINVKKNGKTIEVQEKNYNESNKVEKEFDLSPGEVKKVIFEIQTDQSITSLSNGDLKFLAKIDY